MCKIFGLSLLLFASNCSTAYAYMDPGTGSMLLQGLIGTVAAGITYLSMYYKKIKQKILQFVLKSKNTIDKPGVDKDEK